MSAAIALSASACGADQSVTQEAAADTIISVRADDPAMLNAFAKARSTLDDFLQRAASHDSSMSDASVKVKIADGDEVEYFWIMPFHASGARYSGVISNDPERVTNVRSGQEISFSVADIYDWTYFDRRRKRTLGNFTACALLTHETPVAAEEFKHTYRLSCDP